MSPKRYGYRVTFNCILHVYLYHAILALKMYVPYVHVLTPPPEKLVLHKKQQPPPLYLFILH